jgi:hypothetical protein
MRPFVKVPKLWIQDLAKVRARGSTYAVALELLGQARWTPRRTVKLTNVKMKKLGVGRTAKKLALEQLEKTGLITVEQAPRKSPIVRVWFTD